MNRVSAVGEQHQRKQQTSNAPIAIDERTGRCELRVNDRGACQNRNIVVRLGIRLVANESIEIGHESGHLRWRRGYESSLLHLQAADEVLHPTELSRRGARVPVHQMLVHCADQCAVERAFSSLGHLRRFPPDRGPSRKSTDTGWQELPGLPPGPEAGPIRRGFQIRTA